MLKVTLSWIKSKANLGTRFPWEMTPWLSGHIKNEAEAARGLFGEQVSFPSLVFGVAQLKSTSTLQMLDNSLLKKNEATSWKDF